MQLIIRFAQQFAFEGGLSAMLEITKPAKTHGFSTLGPHALKTHSSGSSFERPALKSTARAALFGSTCTQKQTLGSTFGPPALKSTARAALLSQLSSDFPTSHIRNRCSASSFTLLDFTCAVKRICKPSKIINPRRERGRLRTNDHCQSSDPF